MFNSMQHAASRSTQLLKLCALSGVLALSACASIKPTPPANETAVFNMDGRMAIEMPRSPDKNSSGKIRWDEYPSSTDITLSTPFGNAVALVHLTPTQATYRGSDGSVVTEDSAQALFYRLFGMDMPIANLRDWVGRPNQPLIKVRDENGWHVVVTQTFANPNLAKHIEVSREQPEPMFLNLTVDQRSDANAPTESNPNAPMEQEINLDDLLPLPKTTP